MILIHCVGGFHAAAPGPVAVIMIAALGTANFVSGKVRRHGISSVGLIGISAVAGMIVYALV